MSNGGGEKRKPVQNDVAVTTKKSRGSKEKEKEKEKEEEETTATLTTEEEEVEEFFAILNRIHAAVSYFKKGGRQWTEEGSKLRAMLETENCESDDAVKDEAVVRMRRDEEAVVEENPGFDLNALPGPDCDPA
ncbi:uncharacterized protein LOC133821962 [Humulus lupulus]|uniref:uncharacterized protein LOC133821962 n=1 Tax=Humulus lupulus TaxID=3486 RepID=UPI002B415DEC|nr:uncharacterized protein LOC133821962 [Humulus lupulus]